MKLLVENFWLLSRNPFYSLKFHFRFSNNLLFDSNINKPPYGKETFKICLSNFVFLGFSFVMKFLFPLFFFSILPEDIQSLSLSRFSDFIQISFEKLAFFGVSKPFHVSVLIVNSCSSNRFPLYVSKICLSLH